MKQSFLHFSLEIIEKRNVLQQLVRQLLILRYRRTVLGYFWTLINPLLMMGVMAIVFSNLFKTDLNNFTIFLFAGMIPWTFFSSVVSQSGAAFINNEGLIKKIYLPKILFPLSISIALLIDSVLSFAALTIIIISVGGTLSPALLFLPISFSLLFLFSLGIGMITSIATVFFRDLQYVILIAMQGLFYLTPVLYKPDALAGKVKWLININPVVPFIELFRAPLYLSQLPSTSNIINSVLISTTSIVVGVIIFRIRQNQIVFRL